MFKLVLILCMLACISRGSLAPPEKQYKILMLLPVSSKSHRNVFMPLANALADRGHQVTMLSNHDLQNPKINHFRHGIKEIDFDSMNMFEIGRNPDILLRHFEDLFLALSPKMYDDPVVKKLFDQRKQFDLVLINGMFNSIMIPFGHEQVFGFVYTGGLDLAASAVIGNLQNPAYVSNNIDSYRMPFSFIDKIRNLFFTIMVPRKFRHTVHMPAQKEISKRFPSMPSLDEIQANASIAIMNRHFSYDTVVPLLPQQVEAGGMHCGPAKPLPQDIAKFLSGTTPVVYMSLGSVAKSSSMPPEYKKIILEVFSNLPYKVLWKYEDTSIKLPSNVMIKSWMPQQDILAHPNVKVFISHCGMLGLQEAMYHGKPVIGLPIFGDQPKNGKGLEFKGLAKILTWESLSTENFADAINEIVTNPSYHEKASAVSAAFQDQLQTPVERAVYWTEYVIRHKGAVHLRSPELDLSWIQLLHLDILLLVHLALYLAYRFIRRVFGMCFSSSNAKNKKRGKQKGD